MSERERRASERAVALLREASALRPWTRGEREETLRLLRRCLPAAAPRRQRAVLVPFALATALGLLVVVPLALHERRASARRGAPPAVRHVDLGAVGQLSVVEGADFSLLSGNGAAADHLVLRAGRVCAHIEHREVSFEALAATPTPVAEALPAPRVVRGPGAVAGATAGVAAGGELATPVGPGALPVPRGAGGERSPFLVEAPDLRVIVIGTRFCVEVSGEHTQVSVSEGKVRVENRAGGSAFVVAGQAVSSADAATWAAPPRFPLTALPPPAPAPSLAARAAVDRAAVAPTPGSLVPARTTDACVRERSLDAREACYGQLLAGDDLVAQEALYSLAVMERDERRDGRAALSFFRAYVGRFPGGTLAPEASQNVLSELEREAQPDAALAAANDYLRRFPSEARAPQVQLLRAKILRDELGRPAEALAAYEGALRGALWPALREEALFSKGLCEQRLGRTAAARTSNKAYLLEFPNGRYAAQLAQSNL